MADQDQAPSGAERARAIAERIRSGNLNLNREQRDTFGELAELVADALGGDDDGGRTNEGGPVQEGQRGGQGSGPEGRQGGGPEGREASQGAQASEVTPGQGGPAGAPWGQ